MKRKILLGLSLFAVAFVAGGSYIAYTIESATSRLDFLIMLHQVEILREHLLLQVRGVQYDLVTSGTPYEPGADNLISHALNMGKALGTCFECHHVPEMEANIIDLRRDIEGYEHAISRVLTVEGSPARVKAEKDAAFRTGERLIDKVNGIVRTSNRRLEDRTNRALREIGETKVMLYALLAVTPLLIGVLAYLFVTGLTRPVNVLLQATRKLKGGDLDHRVEGLRGEFGELAASFNEMAASLKEQMARMQRTEQMVVAGELAAGLAHEIKNPLAGIKVSMEVLAAETRLGEEDLEVLSRVREEVKKIEVLMKSFLNFAKPPRPRREHVDVNGLVDSTIAFSLGRRPSPAGNGNGIDVVKRFDPGLPAVEADPMLIQQAFLNVILNASEAMAGGGRLVVETSRDPAGGSISVSFSDTGGGMDPEVLEGVFQPFFTTKPGGTGLGLSITRQLVERHGGSVGASNNDLGGTTITIVLPVGAANGIAAVGA